MVRKETIELVDTGMRGWETRMGRKSALNSAEIFDPTTGQFTLTRGRMHAKRDDLSACLLDDGTVLIAGGYNNQTELIRSFGSVIPRTYIELVILFKL